MTVGFVAPGLHFLAWFALVPWLTVLPRISSERAWLYGTLLGLVYYRIGLAWLCGLAGPLGTAVVVILALWMGLSFRVARMLMARFSTAAMLWAVPLAFVGQEVVRAEGLPRYRCAYLAYGYTQASHLWIAQIASLGGVYVVTLILIAFNVALAHAIIVRRRRACLPAAVVAAVIAAAGLLSQPSMTAAAPTVSVACVQIESYSAHDHLKLAAEAFSHPEKPVFVVLPEHAIVDDADENHHLVRRLGGLARAHDAYICIGAHVRAAPGAACDYDNVALLIGPNGRIVGRQAKCVPLPGFVDGNPATRQAAFDTRHGRVGMYVCYDGSFTDVPRRVVAQGADLLLVPIMNPDDWPAGQRWQQADIAVFRSIELHRWAVRAASSGVSQIVDPAGRVRGHRAQTDGPGVLLGRAAMTGKRTVFCRGGYLVAPAVGIAYLAVVAWLTLVDWRARFGRRFLGGAVAQGE